jgi:branched-chain amino acid transport system permease protein
MKLRVFGYVTSAILILVLIFAPKISPLFGLDISIVTEMLLFAIAAMSVNIMFGYTGLPLFGSAAFFGLGCYGVSLSITYWNAGFFVSILIGVALALLGTLLISWFLLRRRGIYFGLLTIAFGQIFYFIAYRANKLTGGEDGMTFSRPPVNIGSMHLALHEIAMYYLCLGVFLAVILALWYLSKSPFGHTLIAIKQNEVRVRHLGLNSDKFVFVALLLSAGYAGLGGALYALSIMFSFPLELDWHQSGDFFLMTVLGGAGTLWGPLLGALIYVLGKEILSTVTPAWQIYLGGIFIICVIAFPRGILGTIIHALTLRGAGPRIDEPGLEAAGGIGLAAAAAVPEREGSR